MEFDFRIEGLTEENLARQARGEQARKISPSIVAWTAVVVATVYAVSYPGQITIQPSVSGSSTSNRVITVSGTVENPNVSVITLTVNRAPRNVPVTNGRFTSKVPLVRGNNTIQASVAGVAANVTAGSNVINVTAAVPRAAIWIELVWDGPGDIDLYLLLPNGERCYFQNPTTSGAVLDVDNRVSDGPEHVTMEKAIPGDYKVFVHYYAPVGGRLTPVPWRVTMRLADGDIERTFSGSLDRKGVSANVYNFTHR